MYKELLTFLNERESGLAVLHGCMGSGKTTFIKNMISSMDKQFILVTNTIAAHMAEPEFIAFMMENKDSVFILEDCEQILMNREENRFGGAISNILNMSDGLMSDIFNIKFICTFNTDIKNIDEALLRPGRCFVNYEFKPLCAEKSSKLLKSLGHKVDKSREMTLAEIYNYKEDDIIQKPKKIGF
jgi:ATP-dependent 26S proteasome regulatory subunit